MTIFDWVLRGRHHGNAHRTVTPERIAEIRAAVERDGRWERHHEWRISTVTSTLIERSDELGHRTFRVRVSCDYVLEARCPTIRRACEIAGAYENIIQQLWRERGWASWASKTQFEPDAPAV